MNLHGIYPPIATPFADDEVDYAGLRRNVGRWMTTGLRGLLALGSNGEAAFLDEDESERIVATVREGVPRDRVLLAGAGPPVHPRDDRGGEASGAGRRGRGPGARRPSTSRPG